MPDSHPDDVKPSPEPRFSRDDSFRAPPGHQGYSDDTAFESPTSPYGGAGGQRAPSDFGVEEKTPTRLAREPRGTPWLLAGLIVVVLALVAFAVVHFAFPSKAANGGSTPADAITREFAALVAGNLDAACNFVPPTQQPTCLSAVSSTSPTGTESGSITIRNTVVLGNEALVSLTGQMCIGTNCPTNRDPAVGMPAGTLSFAQAFQTAYEGHGGLSPVPCILVNGRWYVDFPSSFGNTGGVPGTGSNPSAGGTPSGVSGAASNRSSIPTGWIRYTDPSGVSLAHPGAWSVQPGVDAPLFVYIDPSTGVPFRRNVNIMLQHAPQSITLSQYTTLTRNQLAGVNHYHLVSAGPVTLSGRIGYRIIWRGALPNSPSDLSFLSEWTVIAGQPWLVTYTSDTSRSELALPAVEELLRTISLP